VAIALTTSGTSPNVIEGLKAAKAKGMLTIALTGEGGGKLASTPGLAGEGDGKPGSTLAMMGVGAEKLVSKPGVAPDAVPDFLLAVPSKNTPRIQEAHLLMLHMLAENIEASLS
jgi:D-sedoheptulose 7-phosphate isomerase